LIGSRKIKPSKNLGIFWFNDARMEIVSKLLGHSSMKVTQDSYGKIVEKKISLEMERLKGR
jgi:integrase/recombinase XerD